CLNAQTTGDGIVAALQVLAAMLALGENISTLCADLKKFPQTMINISLKQPISKDLLEQPKIKKIIADAKLRLKGSHRRILLRPSGTEPLLRVMVEGEDTESVSRIAHELADSMERVLR
ncbi:MAG: phosphoglucosamine mutase, partial [Gammaproteobacteria bacterium]